MIVTVSDLMREMEEISPIELAEDWDNVGLQIGNPEDEIKGIVISLDVTPKTISTAIENGCNMVLSHHPLIFSPINCIRADEYKGMMITEAIKNGINIYSAHTNLDASDVGVNVQLAKKLQLLNVKIPEKTAKEQSNEIRYVRVGELPRAMDELELRSHIEECLSTNDIRLGGRSVGNIDKVMIACGSGAGNIELCANMDYSVLITGDVKYHDYQRAEELGVLLIDAGHFSTEIPMVQALKDLLTEKYKGRIIIESHPAFYYIPAGLK
ncbi:MAG: Nif3-like dinuclear metal center hexameric protein [Tissierellia bacterium]|nr:Nif3-like dinuclear metal center hexameric protein [Tissierellia bacterium]